MVGAQLLSTAPNRHEDMMCPTTHTHPADVFVSRFKQMPVGQRAVPASATGLNVNVCSGGSTGWVGDAAVGRSHGRRLPPGSLPAGSSVVVTAASIGFGVVTPPPSLLPPPPLPPPVGLIEVVVVGNGAFVVVFVVVAFIVVVVVTFVVVVGGAVGFFVVSVVVVTASGFFVVAVISPPPPLPSGHVFSISSGHNPQVTGQTTSISLVLFCSPTKKISSNTRDNHEATVAAPINIKSMHART